MVNRLTRTWRGHRIADIYRQHIKPGDKVLDYGCDDGAVGDIISARLGCRVTGWDAGQEKPAAGYDIVMLNDVMHHVRPSERLNLIRHVTLYGARVLVTETCLSWAAQYCDRGDRTAILWPEWRWVEFFHEAWMRLLPVHRCWVYPLRHVSACLVA